MDRSYKVPDECVALAEENALMKADLYRIGEALSIPAKPYSGHEAIWRDFLPRIDALLRKQERMQQWINTAVDRIEAIQNYSHAIDLNEGAWLRVGTAPPDPPSGFPPCREIREGG